MKLIIAVVLFALIATTFSTPVADEITEQVEQEAGELDARTTSAGIS